MWERMTWGATAAVVVAALTAACGGTSLTEVGGPGSVRCQPSLGGSVPTVGSGGGQVAVPLVLARDCVWSAASEAGWVQVQPLSGQGDGTLTLVVGPNTHAQSRSGSFLINEDRFTITQHAAPPSPGPSPPPPPGDPPSCTFAIDPSSLTFGSAGGEGTFRVVTGEHCAWAAVTASGWVTLLSTPGQIGPGEVRYRVSPFNGRERTGFIVAAGRTHTIRQARDH